MKRFLLFLFLLTLVGCQSPPPTPPSNPHFTSYQLLDVNGRLEDFGKPYINTTPTDQNNLPLPEGFEYVIEEEAAISPDGQYLIYYMQRLDGPAELVIYNRDGSLNQIVRPPSFPGSSFFELTVSSDNQIASTDIRHDADGVPLSYYINVFDFALTHIQSYYIDPFPDSSIGDKTWSPDATMIAFERTNGVSILYLSTGQIETIGPGSNPFWRNDQTLAYFHTNPQSDRLELSQYDLSSQQTTSLLTLPSTQRYTADLPPEISADGRFLALVTTYGTPANPLKSACFRLQQLQLPDFLWPPTCGQILYAFDPEQYNILLINLQDQRLESIIPLESGTDNFAFSPDSQWLSYVDDEGILLYHIPSGETQTYYQRLEGEWFSSLLWP